MDQQNRNPTIERTSLVMANKKDEPAKVVVPDAHDPYAIRTI